MSRVMLKGNRYLLVEGLLPVGTACMVGQVQTLCLQNLSVSIDDVRNTAMEQKRHILQGFDVGACVSALPF